MQARSRPAGEAPSPSASTRRATTRPRTRAPSASHLGTDHAEVRGHAPTTPSTLVPELPHWFDEPFADPLADPDLCSSRGSPARDVTVALSGDGGDELFGGYPGYFIVRGGACGDRRPVARRAPAGGRHRRRPGRRHYGRCTAVIPAAYRPGLLGQPGQADHRRRPRRRRHPRVLRPALQLGGGASPLLGRGRRASDALAGTARTGTSSTIPSTAWATSPCSAPWWTARSPSGTGPAWPAAWRCGYPSWTTGSSSSPGASSGAQILQPVGQQAPAAPPAVPPRAAELVDRPKKGFSSPLPVWLRGPLREWAEELLDERQLNEEGLFDPPWCARAGTSTSPPAAITASCSGAS